MKIDILTLFPEMFESTLSTALFKRAGDRKAVEIAVHDIRDHTHDRHHTADDYPYGGGAGMVLKPEPIFESVEAIIPNLSSVVESGNMAIVLMTPQGRPFSQEVAGELARVERLVLICGHYEGVDERVRQHLVTEEISIGDYVLSGGEIPAMVVLDAVVRLIPGVLGSPASPVDDSHSNGLLEYPQYTRPPDYRGWTVPEVLLSGDHGRINRWRREQSIKRTAERRPDLLEKADLSEAERKLAGDLD